MNPEHTTNPSMEQLLQANVKLTLLRQAVLQLESRSHRTVIVTPFAIKLDILEKLMLELNVNYG